MQAYPDASAACGEAIGTLDTFLAVQTDHIFRIPADRLAEAQAAHLRQVFAYRFDRRSPIAGGALGACHALDVPFVFIGSFPYSLVWAQVVLDATRTVARIGPIHLNVLTSPHPLRAVVTPCQISAS